MTVIENRIRARGAELGFHRVAFSRAGPAPRSEAFRRWLKLGFHGEMGYLARGPEDRANVTRRSPWARSIISVAMDYAGARGARPSAGARGAPAADSAEPGISSLVSRYALGADYHDVLKARLVELARFVQAEAGGRVETRSVVDTSAILERDHAAAGGVGWTGKNAMVIDPAAGSFFFLGEVLTDLELSPGQEMEDLCGSCTRCLEACPTGAIVADRVVDARRCISYLTIELRGAIPAPLRSAVGSHLFGCDVCQEVCPWNRRPAAPADPAFLPSRVVEETSLERTVRLDVSGFAARFRRSAISRAKRAGLVRNALIVAANRQDAAALRAGRALLEDEDPVLRETAVWALSRGDAEENRLARRAREREPSAELRKRMREDLEGSSPDAQAP